jgi:hypothetical protein
VSFVAVSTMNVLLSENIGPKRTSVCIERLLRHADYYTSHPRVSGWLLNEFTSSLGPGQGRAPVIVIKMVKEVCRSSWLSFKSVCLKLRRHTRSLRQVRFLVTSDWSSNYRGFGSSQPFENLLPTCGTRFPIRMVRLQAGEREASR